jgi:hypothetical protein
MSVNKVYTSGSSSILHLLNEVKMFCISFILFLQMSPVSNLSLICCRCQSAIKWPSYFRSTRMDPLTAFSKQDGYEYVLPHGIICYKLLPFSHAQVSVNMTRVPQKQQEYQQCALRLLKIQTYPRPDPSRVRPQCCKMVPSPTAKETLADCPGWGTRVTGGCCYCCWC